MNQLKQLVILFGLFAIQTPLLAQQNELQSVIERAHQLKLSEYEAWQQLLHYKQHVFGGVYSQADDQGFFIAEQGKFDADEELQANLTAFHAPVKEDVVHAQCRFPARLYWLDKQLSFKHSLPTVSCDAFNQWKLKMQADTISLIFPTMFLNNPASMFGHTFLRLDSANKSPLLSYTLNYAAQTDPDDNAFSYVYLGLSGGYPGRFAVQPYYETVKSYGDIEHRDIWEYTLNLTQQEIDQLIRHIWELRSIDFDYYFIRENCSYRLLSLLDVARQDINMTQHHHPVYAIPVDTVRSIEQAGLIKTKNYRPAINSRLTQMYQQMDTPTQVKAKRFINKQAFDIENDLTDLSTKQQAQWLDFAAEVSDYQKDKNQQSQNKVLLARSKIQLDQDTLLFEFADASPETSHLSARWHIGAGEIENASFIEIGFRPVFHDLLDPHAGFIKGTSIRVLDTQLRWYDDEQELELEQLVIFGLDSLSPITHWSTPVSARLEVSIKKRSLTNTQRISVFDIQGAFGYAAEWRMFDFYLLADVSLEYADKLEDDYALFAGAQIGTMMHFTQSRAMLSFVSAQSQAGADDAKDIINAAYQWDLNRNIGLRVHYENEEYRRAEYETWQLSLLGYF